MQPKAKIVRIFLVALIASLLLSACGGGTSGSTWFSLPAIPIKIDGAGNASVLGFSLGAILPAATVQQLQTANIQKLEIRIGYNGIHAYANGGDLPYLAWDAASVVTLQDLLRNMPQVPYNTMIADWLPTLRQIGLGVALNVAPAAGQAEPTIGPFNLSGLAVDKAGNINIAGIAGSALGLPTLDAGTLGLLASLGLDKLGISTAPDGLKLTMNDKPLPSLAYDKDSLAKTLDVAKAFVADAGLLGTLSNVLPQLPGAKIDANLSFTGEPAGALELGQLPVKLNPDGTLSAFGIALGSAPLVPTSVLDQLKTANIQNLNVEANKDGLFLSTNGQSLPQISWNDDSLKILAGALGPLTGMKAEMLDGVLGIVRGAGLKTAVALGDGEAPAEVSKTLEAASLPAGLTAPTIRLNAEVKNGVLSSVKGVGDLAALGLPAITLPPNIVDMLTQLGAKEVKIDTNAGNLNLLLDGKNALTMNYDVKSLQAALDAAAPFLKGSLLENPAIAALIKDTILPLVPSSDVDITITLN
jgi:antitoxin component of MazEF toxin-antitoxin module